MVVCIVEDDATVLSLLAELLQRHGHDPKPVLISQHDTVTTGIERIAATGASIVLMDLGMPVPGLELLSAAQRDVRFDGRRYVIATASLDGGRNVPTSPSIARVAKPYDFDELLAVLEGKAA